MSDSDMAPEDLPVQLSDEDAEIVRTLVAEDPRWLELARALEARADVERSHGLRMLGLAFVYDLISPDDTQRRANSDGPYATEWENAEASYPPRPKDVIKQVRSVWETAREKVDSLVIRSRISDLLFVIEGKSAHEDGRIGAQTHLDLATQSSWEPMVRSVCLARALEVLTELNDQQSIKIAGDQIEAAVRDLLSQEYPGPPLAALRAVGRLKPGSRPSAWKELVAEALRKFERGTGGEGAIELAIEFSDNADEKNELRGRQLQLRMEEANAAEGLTKVIALQRAIELADHFGFIEEREELAKQQQDLPVESLGLQAFETSVEVPVEQVRLQVDMVVGSKARNALDALSRLGTFGPPGGSDADIDRELNDPGRRTVLTDLVSQVFLGTQHSSPTFLSGAAKEKHLASRGNQRRIYAEFYGSVLFAPMIDQAAGFHGRPSHEELSKFFDTELIGPDRGERFARSVELFWDGEYDESAHLIVPRLESVIRDLARHAGIRIAKIARQGELGGVISLNAALRKILELEGPVIWFEYLQALLAEPLSLNLRNEIAHGLIPRVGRGHAALLVHVACHFAPQPHETRFDPDQ